MTERNGASLLYSGGPDSTLAAIELTKEFDLIHLLTFKIGKLHLFTKSWPSHSANELCEIMGGDKFVHRYINIKHLHKTLVSGHLIEDYRKYRSVFVWCGGCKMAMHTQAAIYNIENNIKYLADGMNIMEANYVEQKPRTLEQIREFYARYGITCLNPIYYDKDKRLRHERLRDMGFSLGHYGKLKLLPKIRDRKFGIQPLCIGGILSHLPMDLFGIDSGYDQKMVEDFFADKIEVSIDYIDEHTTQYSRG
jgi:7-cyano-7-deazaguanine synthase in queuosine biosynthesis